jgi:hypothetical protein
MPRMIDDNFFKKVILTLTGKILKKEYKQKKGERDRKEEEEKKAGGKGSRLVLGMKAE